MPHNTGCSARPSRVSGGRRRSAQGQLPRRYVVRVHGGPLTICPGRYIPCRSHQAGDTPSGQPLKAVRCVLSMTTTAESYEVLRQRHVEAFAARLAGEADKLTWPLEQLHALRDMRLRALLRVAKQRSPWHAERLGRSGCGLCRPRDHSRSSVNTLR
jgi:hypothetical protein